MPATLPDGPWIAVRAQDDPEALRMVEEAKRTRAQKLAARCAKLSADIPQQSLPEVLVVGALSPLVGASVLSGGGTRCYR